MSAQPWSERFAHIMPCGSSTTSKAPTLLPDEPEVIVRGEGCRVWDDRGREFIDFRNGLGPVTLGYRFPAVDEAIHRQLLAGITFGHPHPLECQAAELLCELVPHADQARFLKTGGEAIAATIRIARAATGRDHIVHIGYNGWLNTLAPGAPPLPGAEPRQFPGVPAAVSALHHHARWNDPDGVAAVLDRHDVAAVVVASDYAGMAAGAEFYPQLRQLATAAGTLVIYDDIVTGFRIATAGVQEYFGVPPDLAVFSKGIANGMPLSAYTGRREIMAAATGVSSTFGGETLALAAAIACMNTYREQDVPAQLWQRGRQMWSGLDRIFTAAGLPLRTRGFAPCPALTAVDGADASVWLPAFLRAAYRNGVSLYTVSYVNFSHSERDIDEALHRLEKACAELADDADQLTAQAPSAR
ncbi:MAG TPA: aminotransferase class III-fold pyridoxal phosphate-dependent enzyme [Mycobacteriales bacterium]|nr:aminotransferase class III-fold pyridoxal phosphate-dependent enzyme [Mycobacteriales bacterium]